MGTSVPITPVVFMIWDHPHAYGDKARAEERSFPFTGSSPRVWGQVSIGDGLRRPFRIIPTRMGTSFTLPRRHFKHKDHPHAYGDKIRQYIRL